MAEAELPNNTTVERRRRRVKRKVAFDGMKEEVKMFHGEIAAKNRRISQLEKELDIKHQETVALRSQVEAARWSPDVGDFSKSKEARLGEASKPIKENNLMCSWLKLIRREINTPNPRKKHYRPQHKELPHPQRLLEQMVHYLEHSSETYFGHDGESDKGRPRIFQVVDRTDSPLF